MITSNHDNLKIPLENLLAYIINNNSKVYIAKTNVISGIGNINTITINKGNTVNLLSASKNDYDVMYGNSTVYSSVSNYKNTQHLWLIDYNFPAARYNINGYKSNYAILLNNEEKPKWTNTDKGVLIDDIYVIGGLNKIPTRLNGFTATIRALNSYEVNLSGKYNGTLIVNSFNNSLSANFIYNLQLHTGSNKSFSRPFYFNNITYLRVFGSLDGWSVTLRNVNYALVNTNKTLKLLNSNIAVNNLVRISLLSYNTIVSYNTLSIEYKNYIYTGERNTNLLLTLHRNILFNTLKCLKQTLHAVTESTGYRSNLPIGSIVWYPLVWSSFSPNQDKNSAADVPKIITLRGEPNTTDWELCDGRQIPNDCLYAKIYGETNTPQYVVDLDYGHGIMGWHYLTEPTCVQFFPSSIVQVYPTYVAQSKRLADEGGDNKHKGNWLWVGQTLTGNCDLKLACRGNWRTEPYVNVHFIINLDKLKSFNIADLRNKLSIKFDSYCCYDEGNKWWYTWTGGAAYSLADHSSPTETINGVKYCGGYPSSDCFKYLALPRCICWVDTMNCPKMALRIAPTSVGKVTLKWLKLANDPRTIPPLFTNTSLSLRAWYTREQPAGLNMLSQYSPDGGDDYTPTIDYIYTHKLPYALKTYEVKLGNNYVSQGGTLSFDLQFQLGLPATYGYWRCKEDWGDIVPFTRWETYRNRDNTLNGAPYHTFTQATWMSMYNNLRLVWGDTEMKIMPLNRSGITIGPQQFSWGNEDWPYADVGRSVWLAFKTYGSFYNLGLYRRLNPYIKINDNNEKKEIIYEDDMLYLTWKDPVDLIQARNNCYIGTQNLDKLNVRAIANDTLSCCYCLSSWENLDNNIVNFSYRVERADLNDLYSKIATSAKINYFGTDNPASTVFCNVYEKNGNDEYIYIEILDGATIENIFEIDQIITRDETIPDEENPGQTVTIHEEDIIYKDCVILTNTLNAYYDLNYYATNTDNTVPELTYSYYNITRTSTGNYLVSLNQDTINLASRHKLLMNTIDAINSRLMSNYINTNPHNLPIFYNDKDNDNMPSSFNMRLSENIINDGAGIKLYPLLGTTFKVMSATTTIGSYYYDVTYNSYTSGAIISSYADTKTIIKTYGSDNNYTETLHTLTNKFLSGCQIFTNEETYSLSTTYSLGAATVNKLIYKKIEGWRQSLKAILNDNSISNFTINNCLQNTTYNKFLTYINSHPVNYPAAADIPTTPPVISGLD